MAGTIQKAAEAPTVNPREVLRIEIERNATAIGLSLPKGYDRDRFVRLLLTAANLTPELFECTPASFLTAGVTAAQLGLEPNDPRGQAWILPYKDNRSGTKRAQLIIGYRGMLDLVRRSGQVSSIHAFLVYEGDHFRVVKGSDPRIEHEDGPNADSDNTDLITHAYAVAKVNGDAQWVVMTRAQIFRIRDEYAKGAKRDSSPWRTNLPEQMLKTVLRRLCKYLPMSAEVSRAVTLDETGDDPHPVNIGHATTTNGGGTILELPSTEDPIESDEPDDEPPADDDGNPLVEPDGRLV